MSSITFSVVALHARDRQAMYLGLKEGLEHLVQLIRADDGFDQFHGDREEKGNRWVGAR